MGNVDNEDRFRYILSQSQNEYDSSDGVCDQSSYLWEKIKQYSDIKNVSSMYDD